ncbi:MAG: glycogen debranching protein GlgX [Acidimicrobiales bacterium]|nr:glycogen debranching protein GlgX [Acidimicrobiales bacterium]
MPEIWPGVGYPLGAVWTGSGTNFAVFAEGAHGVELCLFDDAGRETKLALPEVTAHCFHGYVPGIGPGQRYGFRAHGPWDPGSGLRFNPQKLMLDPYARAIEGAVKFNRSVFDHKVGNIDEMDIHDSADSVPRSVVVSPYFDWEDDRPPRTPRRDTVLYEAHVKGMTMRHPKVPKELQGTYAGMAHPAIVDHLVNLGVTALELMPVHQFFSESFLADKNLTNYWGYATIGYLAPHNGYSAWGQRGEQVQEFKSLVKTMHAAGIEVILDVVYNHTCEGNTWGPAYCFKGLSNHSYYRLSPDNPRNHIDFTGTGNTLDVGHPNVLQLIMDSLRYWVTDMRVDGFRFDLASALARDHDHVDRFSAFFDIVHQDPVLRTVKLIAEPWDVGDGGYQVGRFPPLWSEWNGQYRDTLRSFWKGEPDSLGSFASRFTGSSDLYESDGRHPSASINFITSHDGFTMNDLVAYNERHNEANGENNEDGDRHNRSWNSGVEGPTDDAGIIEVRQRRVRAMLATLFLSQGVPMLLGGDEIGRTQRGNNNAYCQDNELTWLDWENADTDLLEFTRAVIKLRTDHPVFRRRRFFDGKPTEDGQELADLAWMEPSGRPMRHRDWVQPLNRAIMVFLNGEGLVTETQRGEPIVDDSFLILMNANSVPVRFTVPAELTDRFWRIELDTASPKSPDRPVVGSIEAQAWSVIILKDLAHEHT